MACKEWKLQLVAHVFEELDADDGRALAAHLEDCAACRTELEELRATRRLLAEARPETPPLPSRVLVLSSPSLRRPWLAFAAGFACAALLLGAGVAAGATYGERLGIRSPTAGTLPADSSSRLAELDEALREYRAAVDEVGQDNDRILRLLQEGRAKPLVHRDEFDAELARLGRLLDLRRASDMDLMMSELAATELRTNSRIGETRQALNYVLLASNPNLSEQ